MACNVCGTGTGLDTCSNCHAAHYCSVQHQLLDWPAHSKMCAAVKSATTRFVSERDLIQATRPVNGPFTERVAYLDHGMDLASKLLVMASSTSRYAAERLSLHLTMEDPFSLYSELRLLNCRAPLDTDKDRSCYVYLVVWLGERTHGSAPPWTGIDPMDPVAAQNMLDSSDIFDAPLGLTQNLQDSPHVCATLFVLAAIKARLAGKISTLRNVALLQDRAPPEIIDHIRSFVFDKSMTSNQHFLNTHRHGPSLDAYVNMVDDQLLAVLRELRRLCWGQGVWPLIDGELRLGPSDSASNLAANATDGRLRRGTKEVLSLLGRLWKDEATQMHLVRNLNKIHY